MTPRPRRATYHHGSLRSEMMTACLKLIDEEGIGAVSLRRVAREAQVSSGAPYHHFRDRSELLDQLATQGFVELGAHLRHARAQAGTPQRALSALVEAYVRFSIEHRAYFQLMFRPELTGAAVKHPDVRSAGDAAFEVFTEVIQECRRAGGATVGEFAPSVALVWAAAHGLASLWLDGPLEQRSGQLGTEPYQLTEDVARSLAGMFTEPEGNRLPD